MEHGLILYILLCDGTLFVHTNKEGAESNKTERRQDIIRTPFRTTTLLLLFFFIIPFTFQLNS